MRGLGQLRFEAQYGERDFRVEIRYSPDHSSEGAIENSQRRKPLEREALEAVQAPKVRQNRSPPDRR